MKYRIKRVFDKHPESRIDLGGCSEEEVFSVASTANYIRPIRWFIAQNIQDGSISITDNDHGINCSITITTEPEGDS